MTSGPGSLRERLKAVTQARIGLGRVGTGLPTAPLLAFQMDHAMARDAVHATLDMEAVARALGEEGAIVVASQAENRAAYLQRPDLGRRLEAASTVRLRAVASSYDLVVVLGDGLSARAVEAHAPAVVAALREQLAGWRIAPVVLARQARVALADEIGESLGAAMSLMLIGERPGLSSPDSLGAYLTWGPRSGRADSERNCVSNIRPPRGLSYEVAAAKLAWLLRQARARALTGVELKDDFDPALAADVQSRALEV
jgi:ethanolamine ammonia-lyase small subunit